MKELLEIYAAATRKAVGEVVRDAARLFAQNAQKETLLQTGRGKKGRATSIAVARAEQRAALERRIIEERLHRRKNLSDPKRYLAKGEIRAYARAVKRRTGELAAAWNATLAATGGKYAAGTRKHGTEHGDFSFRENATGAMATVSASFDGAAPVHAVNAAQKTVAAYFRKQAKFALRKILRK